MKHLLLLLALIASTLSCKKDKDDINTTPNEIPEPPKPPTPEPPKTFQGPEQLTYDVDSISVVPSEVKVDIVRYANLIGEITAPDKHNITIVGLVKDKDSLQVQWAFSKETSHSRLFRKYWYADYGKWVNRNELNLNLNNASGDIAVNAFLTFSKSGKQVNRITKLLTSVSKVTADIYSVDFGMTWQQVKDRETERSKKYFQRTTGSWGSTSPDNGFSSSGTYTGQQVYFEFKEDKLIKVIDYGLDFGEEFFQEFLNKVKSLGLPKDPIIKYDHAIGGYVLENPQTWLRNGIKITFQKMRIHGKNQFVVIYEKL